MKDASTETRIAALLGKKKPKTVKTVFPKPESKESKKDSTPESQPRILPYEYELTWTQNMGRSRGTLMSITTKDWETGKHVWKNCCKDRTPLEVRDVKATVKIGKTKPQAFDPEKTWPRPPRIF